MKAVYVVEARSQGRWYFVEAWALRVNADESRATYSASSPSRKYRVRRYVPDEKPVRK